MVINFNMLIFINSNIIIYLHTMKLFLTSDGFKNYNIEKDFLDFINNNKKLTVAFINTANDKIEWVCEDKNKYAPKSKYSRRE